MHLCYLEASCTWADAGCRKSVKNFSLQLWGRFLIVQLGDKVEFSIFDSSIRQRFYNCCTSCMMPFIVSANLRHLFLMRGVLNHFVTNEAHCSFWLIHWKRNSLSVKTFMLMLESKSLDFCVIPSQFLSVANAVVVYHSSSLFRRQQLQMNLVER